MTLHVKQSVRLALALLVLGGTGAVPATAQVVQPPVGAALPHSEDASSALSRHLTTLANNPQSVAALTGAGRAALSLGDAEAALSFFARAEEIAPMDGRVKAGIGSALVLMEQPRSAQQFFAEAARLGIAEAEFAGDRGLAHDLLGNPKAAQRDYQVALARIDDPEVRRRLALSQAIGGDRSAALATIDAQLRRQDRAAWRVQAFILALTGDQAGASQTVQAVMPGQAAALQPFLARLPNLSLAERAAAVHFGHFPGDTMAAAAAPAVGSPATASDPLRAGQPDDGQAPLGAAVQSASPVATAPASASVTAAAPPPPLSGARADTIQVAVAGPRPPPAEHAAPPIAGVDFDLVPRSPPAATTSGPSPSSQPSSPAAPTLAASDAAPLDLPAPQTSTNIPSTSASTVAVRDFADIAALVSALPDAPVAATTGPPDERPSGSADRPAGRSSAATAARESKASATRKPAAKPAPAKPKEPRRIWVQVASGADERSLPQEFGRLRGKAPKLFADRSGWTTPLRATNRLLVGPFKSEREAQSFVNELSKVKLTGFSWTSPEGQEIKKLPRK